MGNNMFAYCFNNPVNLSDPGGNWPKLSAIFSKIAVAALVVAAVATVVAIAAVAAPALITIGGATVSSATITTVATTVGTQALGVATVLEVAAAVSENEEQKQTKSYSVYFLEDQNGTIQYVGRVTDEGYSSRMAYHYATRNLTPAQRISGLSYNEARGLEELGMIQCHTLNAKNPINNQIHGISIRNRKGEIYMNAACNYLFNRAENWVLNLFE